MNFFADHPQPDFPALSDEQLAALVAYGDWHRLYHDHQAEQAAAGVATNLRHPDESVDEWMERVPAYYRRGVRVGDLREALKSAQANEAESRRWSHFEGQFRQRLAESQRKQAKAAFAAHSVVVSDDLTPTLDAYVNLGVPLPDAPEGNDPQRYRINEQRSEAFRWEYREVSVDGEFAGYVRRKPKQSFWAFSETDSYYNGQRYVRWINGGYGARFRNAKDAADGLAKVFLKAREEVSA